MPAGKELKSNSAWIVASRTLKNFFQPSARRNHMEYENRVVRPSRENVLAKVVDGEAILINRANIPFKNSIGTCR